LLSLPNAPLAPDFVAVGERPGASVLSELPQTAFQAAPSAAAAANGSPPAPATAYAGEPAVSASWLAERETALTAVRSDVEARRAQAQASAGSGPGWVDAQMVTDESGRLVSASGGATVFVADPGAVPQLIGWDEGGPVYAGVMGRYLEFSEEAFGAHYRAQAQTQTDTPLQTLARLYDTDAPDLLARHPEIWGIATTDHALNAGPAPVGQAMGDAGQLAMLDLYMADPQVAELIQRYGGSVAPATSGIALEQVRIHGQARYEQMTRLANAMQAVRSDYSSAMQQAATANGGPGWVEQPRMVTISDEGGATRTEPMVTRDESGVATTVTERFFDPDRFTAWYMQQPGAANQAFADFYGQSHTQWATDESGARMAASIGFDNPNWQLKGLGGPMRHTELVSLDPNHAPRLNNDGAVGFDFDAGWATHSSNIHQKRDWFETVVQVAMVAAVAYISAGTLGPAAAGAAGMTTTTAAGATVLTAGGMVVSAAVVGAATSFVSGAMNGNLSLKGVLTGALSGALTAGLANGLSSVTGPLTGAGAIAGRMTVQGGVQALLGGSFKDGAIAGFASGLADLAGQNMTAGIDKAVDARTMNAGEAFAARSLARVFTSAVRTLGSPGDPQYAFASDLVGSVVNAGLDSTQPLPGAAFAGTAFDDDGNLMPGVVDANAPIEQQRAQLAAQLQVQGFDSETAAQLAAAQFAPPTGSLPATRLAFDDEGNLQPGIVDPGAAPVVQQRQLLDQLLGQGVPMAEASRLVWQWATQDTGNSANPLSTMGPDGEPRPQGSAELYTGRAYDGSPARPATPQELALLENAVTRIQQTEFPQVLDLQSNPNQRLFHVSFEGTWNDRDQQPIDTNPAELQRLLERSLGTAGRPLYLPGIGSQGSSVSNVADGSVNAGPAAVEIVDRAYTQFSDQVARWARENPGTEVVVSLAGFSRGGAQALDFANRLQSEGVADPARPGQYLIAPGAIRLGPIMLYEPVDMTGGRLNVQVPSNASSVLVVGAGNEYRAAFPTVSVVDPANPNDPRITRIEVPGAHTDVGRGYDQGIGNYTLQMGRDYFARSGILIGQLPPELRPGASPVMVHDSLTDGLGNQIWSPRSGGRQVVVTPNPPATPGP
jgi:hypothetical protein